MSEQAPSLSVATANGKYTVKVFSDGSAYTFCHSKPWRELVGDKFVKKALYL